MLIFIFAPLWAALLGILYVWGLDPMGPVMQTLYILAVLTSFFAMLLSEDI